MSAVTMVRIFFLLVVAAGLALGIGYPYVVRNLGGYEIARIPAHDPVEGFRPAEFRLDGPEELVRIGVEVVIRQTTNAGEGGFALLMIVLRDGAEFMRGAVELSGPSPVGGSVQSGRLSYRGAVVIDPAVPGAYVVALEPTVGMTGEPESVELVVTAPAIEWDPRLQPIGYVLIAVGFIGLVIAIARPGRRVAEKPPQRWGRGGGS